MAGVGAGVALDRRSDTRAEAVNLEVRSGTTVLAGVVTDTGESEENDQEEEGDSSRHDTPPGGSSVRPEESFPLASLTHQLLEAPVEEEGEGEEGDDHQAGGEEDGVVVLDLWPADDGEIVVQVEEHTEAQTDEHHQVGEHRVDLQQVVSPDVGRGWGGDEAAAAGSQEDVSLGGLGGVHEELVAQATQQDVEEQTEKNDGDGGHEEEAV